MKTLKLFSVIALSALAVACGNNSNNAGATAEQAHDCTKCEKTDDCIIGRWVQPVSGQEGKFEGIEFKKDGIAESINMATLQIEKWSKDSSTVTLSGKSIGNGVTSDFTETYTLAKGDNNTITLIKDGSVIWSLSKEGACSGCSDGCKDVGEHKECKEGGCGKEKAKAEEHSGEDDCSGCGGCDK